MASLLSGSVNEDTELVEIETNDFHLYIKGKPFHDRYEGLQNYKMIEIEETMEFSATGEGVQSVLIYDLKEEKLTSNLHVAPIFFENRVYQLVITPKSDKKLSFYHEHPALRKAVTSVGTHPHQVLMGNLQFQNEVGYSTFEIHDENKTVLLQVTMEIYPIKLNYKEDYKKLLEEVNEEVYNLAYDFIKKTYLGATTSITSQPTWSEFYRLFDNHFTSLMNSINVIERQPHHQLIKTYKKVRGDQLKKVDALGRNYLRKRPQLFRKVLDGLSINGQKMMPEHGLNVKKELSYNTLENQFIKYMMKRLVNKLDGLLDTIESPNHPYKKENDADLLQKISQMRTKLEGKIRSPIWRQVDELDRSVMSLVMQMAPGYRDVYKIYLTVSRGLILHGQLYNMSVKDVATLYEYWTFIKLGQILAAKYPMVSQDIIKVKRSGLIVRLDETASAKRVFKHPVTSEKVTLHFQKANRKLPTVSQKPDSILSIEKNGKNHAYHYIFDAKYRIDFAAEGTYYKRNYLQPGPLEEDINTMHRYRDALVQKENGPYERYSFGAYVLFPWFDEEGYEEHDFYKSIDQVNIGGFPFLPNSTRLVEQFIERLIEKSPEELQEEGILPKGTLDTWQSSLEEKVLIGKVENDATYQDSLKNKRFIIPLENLRAGWQEAKYVGLYLPKKEFGNQDGVSLFGEIEEIKFSNGNDFSVVSSTGKYVVFEVKLWKSLDKAIKPVKYGIMHYMMTTLYNLKEATELPELFMKSPEEMKIWKMLRRISKRSSLQLDSASVDLAEKVSQFEVLGLIVMIDQKEEKVVITRGETDTEISLKLLREQPSKVFRVVSELLVR
ncbi:DUF2357 domain-containing protein [Ornithinibacillus sp. L9]|uniref:DUF2357 domain-containing protein n=1 Tax=Ornithinibacillus caprae TaxID=2678566 RepID=A0A6N8FE13_9BACI|nr:restriction endonuclease-like protein [Ornithinibacillus caprae]MUK87770.1 DUF2357 domain-containing protein [Ornithinibacillus caprae]